MKVRSSGCPHPTTTCPWMRRSSMRKSSMATRRAPRDDECGAPLVGGVLGGLDGRGVAMEHEVEQRGEIRPRDDHGRRTLALQSPSGHCAAPRWQVGEDDGEPESLDL